MGSADKVLDNVRIASGCPGGKSLTLHVEQMRARVEKLERVREAADAVIKEMREEGTSRLRELFGFYTCDCFANLDAALAECPEVPRG